MQVVFIEDYWCVNINVTVRIGKGLKKSVLLLPLWFKIFVSWLMWFLIIRVQNSKVSKLITPSFLNYMYSLSLSGKEDVLWWRLLVSSSTWQSTVWSSSALSSSSTLWVCVCVYSCLFGYLLVLCSFTHLGHLSFTASAPPLFQVKTNLSDLQFLFFDLVLVTSLAIVMGTGGPCAELHPRRPPASLLSLPVLCSLLVHFVLLVLIQVSALLITRTQSWWEARGLKRGVRSIWTSLIVLANAASILLLCCSLFVSVSHQSV